MLGMIMAGAQMLGGFAQMAAQDSAMKAQKTVDEANAKVQNMLGQANADAANAVRGANNGFAVAQSGLSNLLRSLGNQGKLQASGDAVNSLNTNLVRLQDQAVTGDLNQQIQAAEQLGAVRAATAASGAGGTSSAMLHQTMQLSQARAETTRDQKVQYQTYDMLAQRAGLMSNMVMSLDQGQTFAQVDYGINTAPLAQAPFRAAEYTQGNGLMQFLNSGAGAMLGQGIGNLFGGGAAGAAAGGGGGIMGAVKSLFSPLGGESTAQTFAVKTSDNIQEFLLK